MLYRNLGRSGVKVSEIALGTWLTFGNATSDAEARGCIEEAYNCGINFFDTADAYAVGDSERVLGQALSQFERDELFVATKVFYPMSQAINDRGLSRKHITHAIEGSLRRLGMDYIDLYQCHYFDEQTPLEETVRAMNELITRGKILYWGVSNWPTAMIREACAIADRLNAIRPISNQPEYNMLSRELERDVMPVCATEGLGLVVYSPLAQGILTGKYKTLSQLPQNSRAADSRQNESINHYLTQANLDKVEKLTKLAKAAGVTTANLALAWCLRRAEVASLIIGASRIEQVSENVMASGMRLTDDLVKEIDAAMA
jgi:voltage-dependent potassium channel beta subunit